MRMRSYSQSSTVMVACGPGDWLVAARPRLRDHLAARWHSRRLDRALASGVPPEASAPLALRAQRLTEPEHRWSMAEALRRIVRDAGRHRSPRLGRVMPDRRAVQAACDELNALAETLDDPGPVAAHGVAQAWLLLTDGTGPLYNPGAQRSLRAGAARAVHDLRPSSTF